jgi:hypothetical protein
MFSHRVFFLAGVVLLLTCAFLGLTLSAAAHPATSPPTYDHATVSRSDLRATNALTPVLWLPNVARMFPEITGRVTYAGSPAAGIHLQLRFWDGATWSTRLEAITNANGDYRFLYPPPLLGGQSYYVRYLNDASAGNVTDSRYLWIWGGPDINSYTGGMVSGSDFDIANVVLASPPPNATVGLPVTFVWQPRAATPTDNYLCEVFDLQTLNYWLSPAVGYSNQVVLPSLASGMAYGRPYGWDVWVSDGFGSGVSYYYHRITFRAGAPAAQLSTESADVLRRADRFEAARIAGAGESGTAWRQFSTESR